MFFWLNAYAQRRLRCTWLRSKMWIHSHFLANACFSGFLFECTKIEQFGFSPETVVDIGSTIFHQQSYPQAVAI
jgi:hypothetical protein